MSSLLGCFWKREASFFSMCFHVFSGPLHFLQFGMISGGVLGGIWGAVDLGKSCQSVQPYAFSGFGPFWCGVRFEICFWKGSGMHFVRFWNRLGHPWALHLPTFASFFRACFWRRFREGKQGRDLPEVRGPAAGVGPAKLAFARSWNWFYTPSAMPEAWGGGLMCGALPPTLTGFLLC